MSLLDFTSSLTDGIPKNFLACLMEIYYFYEVLEEIIFSLLQGPSGTWSGDVWCPFCNGVSSQKYQKFA